MRVLGRLVSFGGMVISQLRMLASMLRVAFFIRLCGVPMCFSGLFVVRGGFVVIVFGHYGSCRCLALRWPICPRRVSV